MPKLATLSVVKRKPPATDLPDVASYSALRDRVKRIVALGRQKMEEIGLKISWEMGRSIHAHVLQNGDRAAYGKQVILKLARDLKVSDETLYQARRFYEAYPISKLTWKLPLTHYLALARIPDKKKRLEMEAKAEKEGWVAEELEKKVRAILKRPEKAGGNGKVTPELLEPKKGRIGIYRLIEHGGNLNIDLGFTSYTEIESAKAQNFKALDLIRFSKDGRMEEAKGAKDSDLFTYEAEVERVVDADTIWMKIWTKRPDWVKEKLRLRGIDAPELDTPEGKAAKRFVESLVKKAVAVTITTTKPDKWDRYLSDVFLKLRSNEEIFLNNLLLEKGHAVRKDKFSLVDWDK